MNPTANRSTSIDSLSVFTFLWACQALVHQEFYILWLPSQNVFGWIVTVLGLATLLSPRSTRLLFALAVSSIVYNVDKWPFVVNHILLESMANMVIVLAIAGTWARNRHLSVREQRRAIYERFSPVLMTTLVIMYYFAFVAKLNHDFFNVELSCVTKMYGDLVDRFPFLPNDLRSQTFSLWATLIVEAAIPVLLSFRRTRWIAIAIGMPFHFVLGLVGHRTFSALAYGMYAMFLMPSLASCASKTYQRFSSNESSPKTLNRVRVVVILGVSLLIWSRLSGNYESGIGPLKFFRIPWAIWIIWSLTLMSVYAYASAFYRRAPSTTEATSFGPGLLWLFLGVVLLNGCSQYLGFKTETCFTMYSNLRTEAGVNNHLFLPALKLTNYQEDLVEIVHVTQPDGDDARYPALIKAITLLHESIEREQLVTRFELRRAATMSRKCGVPFFVRYLDNDALKSYDSEVTSEHELALDHPILLAKLLRFRPVDKGTQMCCQH